MWPPFLLLLGLSTALRTSGSKSSSTTCPICPFFSLLFFFFFSSLTFVFHQKQKFSLPKTVMVHFNTHITESILTSPFPIWYPAATSSDESKLQCIMWTTKVISCISPGIDFQDPMLPGILANNFCFKSNKLLSLQFNFNNQILISKQHKT